ncbi:MAG: DegV family protein [Acutalibacter sp.]|nr:DegV family protein [Acutalibacter sp.]
MNIQITADSTCDLTPELVKKYGIIITPLAVNCGSESYRDGVDITPDVLYEKIAASGQLASTAAVNTQEYSDVFSAALRDHDAVIHFTISSAMSACYQNACAAAKELENVWIVDSRNLSTGIAHLVLDACEMASEGTAAAEIFKELELRKEKLDVSFVVDTLEYLRKGGRCTAVAAIGANLLKLHPCIFVKDGEMGVGKKYRGKLTDCLTAYVKDRLADPNTIDTRRIFITDSGIDESIRASVEKEVRKLVSFDEIIHTRAGCTVSSHCGPGTLGILYYRK